MPCQFGRLREERCNMPKISETKLQDLEIRELPENALLIDAVILMVKYITEDGDTEWCFRISPNLGVVEACGAIEAMRIIKKSEIEALYIYDESDTDDDD
jgi:hypothetical protein